LTPTPSESFSRATPSGERPVIGVLVDWLYDDYQNTLLAGVRSALEEEGADMFCFVGGAIGTRERYSHSRTCLYDLVSTDKCDGLIVFAGSIANFVGPEVLRDYCRRFEPLPMCSVSVSVGSMPAVLVDNATGMRAAISHLIEVHGRRRIAFVRGPAENEEAERRFAVYREVLAAYGIELDPALVVTGNFNRNSGYEAVGVLFDERRATCDALVAANDAMALGAMTALAERGIDVPQAVAVTGFDDVEEAQFATVPLTTVRQPLYEQGKAAAWLVLARCRGETVEEKQVLHTEVVLRQSCGCFAESLFGVSMHHGEVLDPSSSRDRQRILALMRSAVPDAHTVASPWAEQLLAAESIVEGGSSRGALLRAFDDVLGQVLERRANPRAWQSLITTMRSIRLAELSPGSPEWVEADETYQLVRVLVGQVAERAQAQERLLITRSMRTLQESGEALATTFDVRTLAQVVAEHCPRLGIPLCIVSLYQPDAESFPSSESRLIVAHGVRSSVPTAGIRFDSQELAPAGFLPDRRISLMFEPLFFRDEVLGFVIFEMGAGNGRVFEALREQISGALKGARLVEQVVREETRRQHAERERLAKEVEIASRIQTTILPQTTSIEGLEIAAAMVPCAEVGGDYYDVIPTEGGCWIGIGDVAGHGLQSGLVMLMIQSVVSGLVRREPGARPSEMLGALNSVLFDNIRNRLRADEHATLTLLRYEANGRLVFAGSHEELIIWRAEERRCEMLSTTGPWVGAVPSIARVVSDLEWRLGKGDVLLLYTDGIVEAEDKTGTTRFGVERLVAAFERLATREVEAIRDGLFATLKDFTAEQVDDMSLVVIRRRG
jgi:DNA-binding LacI/PurR family transcriptional regulator/serine phosphatase RsbU (regulator of sigma subunit)